jgi:hypothetical protein
MLDFATLQFSRCNLTAQESLLLPDGVTVTLNGKQLVPRNGTPRLNWRRLLERPTMRFGSAGATRGGSSARKILPRANGASPATSTGECWAAAP